MHLGSQISYLNFLTRKLRFLNYMGTLSGLEIGIGNRFRDVEQERAPRRALLREEEAIRRFAHLSAVEELGKRARGPRIAMSSFRGRKEGRRGERGGTQSARDHALKWTDRSIDRSHRGIHLLGCHNSR